MLWEIFISFIGLLDNAIFLVSYVTNNNSFPLPLSEEDEQMYIVKFKQGDNDARNILVERNLRLVAHIVKKYNYTGKEVDDLISVGTIGLIKAITTFDNDKGTRLATYAARCIENAIHPLWKHLSTQIICTANIFFIECIKIEDSVRICKVTPFTIILTNK